MYFDNDFESFVQFVVSLLVDHELSFWTCFSKDASGLNENLWNQQFIVSTSRRLTDSGSAWLNSYPVHVTSRFVREVTWFIVSACSCGLVLSP